MDAIVSATNDDPHAWLRELPPGADIVLKSSLGQVTDAFIRLPDGARIEMPQAERDNLMQKASLPDAECKALRSRHG